MTAPEQDTAASELPARAIDKTVDTAVDKAADNTNSKPNNSRPINSKSSKQSSSASLLSQLRPYIELMRWHKPVGIFLLLWPTLWALWLAAGGVPPLGTLLVFVLGTALMRACGCVINDYADRKFDGAVERTKGRPLATGKVSAKQALQLFLVLALLSFALVLSQNRFTVMLSFAAIAIASVYPFMKRYSYFPQVVLGAAFAWAIPMAFAAVKNELPTITWLLYMSTLMWVLAYDTLYGMVDRDDDRKIGIKSTAILFGDADILLVSLIHGFALLGLFMLGLRAELGAPYFAGWTLAALLVLVQMLIARSRKPADCFRAFQLNNLYGLVLTAGLVADYSLR
ncbi:4-hydroxybenzoate octaprenyltransferase [Permianibacter sp. IMCC34836]|uniref:4-hydroxybenzoate octaprenyltransferase n=1 Tax=Permianibacter fluminis TaxID=2738515 RepID=UPI001556E5F6|nr:4-hydroxybenzoate octaprenyltransferase [Permianibacter fluminis]NQD35421.1 4-hydroxybenzoate octaprenyltransferase [Permianibacter fluminis]